jgi:hypothetical protein
MSDWSSIYRCQCGYFEFLVIDAIEWDDDQDDPKEVDVTIVADPLTLWEKLKWFWAVLTNKNKRSFRGVILGEKDVRDLAQKLSTWLEQPVEEK